MILTVEILQKAKSSKGGFSLKQIKLLGYNFFKADWQINSIGKDFPPEVIDNFINLKDQHLK